MHKNILFLSLAALLASSAQAAENKMRPGLWEISTSSRLLAFAEQIPPDQMQNLSNLARQYGFEMPKIKNGAANSRVCVTKEMSEQNIPPYFYHRQSGCEVKNATRIENRYSADLVCTSRQINGQGKTAATLNTPESFAGQTEFSGTVRGVNVDEKADTSGTWLAANCAEENPR